MATKHVFSFLPRLGLREGVSGILCRPGGSRRKEGTAVAEINSSSSCTKGLAARGLVGTCACVCVLHVQVHVCVCVPVCEWGCVHMSR